MQLQVHAIAEGDRALALATVEQLTAYRRLEGRCSIRGVLMLSDEALQVGFETNNGRDREAVIAPSGRRIQTRNTWS